MNRLFVKLVAAGLVMACSAAGYAQQALGTAFTYQGVLDQSGSPVNATADFQFSLFDAASAGNLVAGPVSVNNVTVTDGLFTVSIDFGATAFNGQARWLGTAVRSPAGGGSFTPLSQRQKLTAAPYALKVPGIDGFSLDAADGSPTDALFVDNAGKVGIGMITPAARLDVKGDGDTSPATGTPIARFTRGDASNFLAIFADSSGNYIVADDPTNNQKDLRLQTRNNRSILLEPDGTARVLVRSDFPAVTLLDTGLASTQSGFIGFNSSGGETGWVGFGTPGSPHFSVVNARSGGNIVLSALGSGGNIVLSPGAGGVVSVPVLEITGADLAEKFPASERLEPGMVVAIDPQNPGKMCLARGAYNRCVAGVVSGANNFSAGAVLGNLPGCEDAPPVALSGRVYVHCDAASGAIQPGDLLTTSDTPGHAMKSLDRERSHGAVIGKAMTALESGRGTVMVLVNLQ